MKPIRWTNHARKEMAAREIAEVEVEAALTKPDLVAPGNPPRSIFMRRYFDEVVQAEMLLRVVVEETDAERVVITLYKTSKIKKYFEG